MCYSLISQLTRSNLMNFCRILPVPTLVWRLLGKLHLLSWDNIWEGGEETEKNPTHFI